MESLFMKNLIFSAQITVPKRNSINPIRVKRICSCSWKISFKKSDFQDFRDYVKPSRLLPSTNVKFCGDWSLETLLNHSKLDTSNSIYQVKLQTSSAYGSDLTDINSEVLLCLIDENGDSILQRISAALENDRSVQSQGSNLLYFQRGSVDEFIFEGPKLGKLEAVWISPESGQWRLGGMSLTVISLLNSASVGNEKKLSDCTAIQYDFDIEDVLLGEKSDSSMMEFRPCSVTEFSEDNIVSLSEKTSPSSSVSTQNISNEDTMKEYADLKLSLLLYDAILTIAGSSIAFLAGEKSAIAFLTGGIGGFLYLLLVQRSVDGIPSSELTPITTIAAKYALGDVAKVLTPQDLMLGTIGFLLSKGALVGSLKLRPILLVMRQLHLERVKLITTLVRMLRPYHVHENYAFFVVLSQIRPP